MSALDDVTAALSRLAVACNSELDLQAAVGLKKAQATGIVDPNAPLTSQHGDVGNHIKLLAEQCLAAGAANA